MALLDQALAASWFSSQESAEARRFLAWAARLHEIGLAISFHSYHKHGAYILENSPLPGFSRDDAQVIATLVLAHRRKLTRDIFTPLPRHLRERALRLAVLLRIAVRLHRNRAERLDPDAGRPQLEISGRILSLTLPEGFLASHPLTAADFDEEAERLASAGFVLIAR
jgi:exopolyphosphatase/guanosine-5'-triphosphate,3'-diphosphate pyrophosphatase